MPMGALLSFWKYSINHLVVRSIVGKELGLEKDIAVYGEASTDERNGAAPTA